MQEELHFWASIFSPSLFYNICRKPYRFYYTRCTVNVLNLPYLDFPRNMKRSDTNQIYIEEKKRRTYNSEDSLVVTHPTTNSPACGLSTAERTGSPIFHTLWSYVLSWVWDSPIAKQNIDWNWVQYPQPVVVLLRCIGCLQSQLECIFDFQVVFEGIEIGGEWWKPKDEFSRGR